MALHAVVPAAGAGKRFGSTLPKQYLLLAGLPVMSRTLSCLSVIPGLQHLVVAVAPDDARARELPLARPDRITWVSGGAERSDSVLAGLLALTAAGAADSDWVLVHDVARPLLRVADVQRLVAAVVDHPVGGLLAMPVRDTMKRADAAGAVEATVPRELLWHALTPQLFRLGLLREALQSALADGVPVTDEASAVERLGLRPLLVEGARDNLKITYPDDLALAEALLAASQESAS